MSRVVPIRSGERKLREWQEARAKVHAIAQAWQSDRSACGELARAFLEVSEQCELRAKERDGYARQVKELENCEEPRIACSACGDGAECSYCGHPMG